MIVSPKIGLDDTICLAAKESPQVAGVGCHSVGVEAAGWLESALNAGVCG